MRSIDGANARADRPSIRLLRNKKKKPRLVTGAISLILLVVMGRIELPTYGL